MIPRRLLVLFVAAILLTGCSLPLATQIAPNPSTSRPEFLHKPRKLLVFMDGTNNEWLTRTNVRRLFEVVAAQEDPERLCFYSEGVGTANTTGLTGQAFGYGLKNNTLAAYQFLADNYRPGDKIYVFGFSRGAHSARTLCGLLAHLGLWDAVPEHGQTSVPLRALWRFCQDLPEPTADAATVNQVLAANRTATKTHFAGKQFNDVEVQFLGLWDTVPGLPFTKYSDDAEVPGQRPVPRYRIRPYPNIRFIAHAIALDETRSQFSVLRVGGPLDPAKTEVQEVWFPGAHSDVGGGYKDSNDLAGLSLDWMLQLLRPHGLIKNPRREQSLRFSVYGNPLGILHHPEKLLVHELTSDVVIRALPKGALFHHSFLDRAKTKTPLPEEGSPDIAYNRAYPVKDPANAGEPETVVKLWRADGTFDEATFAQWFKVYEAGNPRTGRTRERPLRVEQIKAPTVKAIYVPTVAAPNPEKIPEAPPAKVTPPAASGNSATPAPGPVPLKAREKKRDRR